MSRTSFPLPVFQSFTVLSSPPVTTRAPSALKEQLWMRAVWPSSVSFSEMLPSAFLLFPLPMVERSGWLGRAAAAGREQHHHQRRRLGWKFQELYIL